MTRYSLPLGALCVGALLLSGTATACEDGSTTLFSCIAKKSGKQIEVCDAKKTINYTFGKPGKTPELAIAAKRADVSTFQWQGIGRYISYAVNIPNGEYLYRVFWGADRLTEEHAVEAGVNVEKKGKLLATVYCTEDSIQQNIEGVNLKPEAE